MADVEITITADNQATQVISELNAQMNGLNQGVQDLNKTTQDLGGNSGGLAKTNEQLKTMQDLLMLDNIERAGQNLTGVFQRISGAVNGLTQEYDAYVQQVDRVSRMTGTSLEESSRMIQMADDARVSYETLVVAMRSYSRANGDAEGSTGKLSDKIAKLREEISVLEAKQGDKAGALQDRIAAATASGLESLKTKYESLSESIADTERKLAQQNAELRNTQTRMSTVGANQVPALKKKYDDLSYAISKTKEALSDKRSELAKVQAQMQDGNIPAANKLKAQLADMGTGADSVAAALANKRAELQKLEGQQKGGNEPAMKLDIALLGKMSDEYLKIQPGIQRTKWLLDNFGRSGLDMARIMEMGSAKIKENSKAIEDGLVVKEEDKKLTEKLFTAQDGFNDKLMSMRIILAKDLIPAQAAFYNTLSTQVLPVVTGLLDKFNTLDQATKDNVIQIGALAVGFIGFSGFALSTIALLGRIWLAFTKFIGVIKIAVNAIPLLIPALMNAWKWLTALASLIQSGWLTGGFMGIASAIVAAVGPVAALTAAFTLLFVVIIKYGRQALTTLTQLGLMIGRLFYGNNWFKSAMASAQSIGFLSGKANGGPVVGGQSYIVGERGPELFTPSGSGYISPNSRLNSGGTMVLNFSYAPAVSLGNRNEAETIIAPYVESVVRRYRR